MSQNNPSGGNGTQGSAAFAGAGISTTQPTASPITAPIVIDDDEQVVEEPPPQKEKKSGRQKNWTLILGSILVILFMTGGVLLWWLSQGSGTRRIQEHVQDTTRQNSNSAPSDSQMTQSAIENARSQTAPVPSTTQSTTAPTTPQIVVQPNGVASTTGTPTVVTPGVAGTVQGDAGTQNQTGTRELPSSGNSTATQNQTASVESAEEDSEPNPQRSFLFGEDAAASHSSAPASGAAPGGVGYPNVMVGASRARATEVARPPFGAMIPLRSLGAIYSLRTGALVRLAATRAITGDGWSIPNKTIFVGAVRQSEADRIAITIIGFIDPHTGLLVRTGGDLYDVDGGAGVQGRKRRLDNRWLSFFGRAADTGVRLTEAALRGRSGSTIILPSAQGISETELSTIRSSNDRREYIEVQAGKICYVMITDLPREIEGVDGLERMTGAQLASTLDVNGDTATGMSDAELAQLISNGSPDEIREALPRMNPQMRRLAEAYLKYANR